MLEPVVPPGLARGVIVVILFGIVETVERHSSTDCALVDETDVAAILIAIASDQLIRLGLVRSIKMIGVRRAVEPVKFAGRYDGLAEDEANATLNRIAISGPPWSRSSSCNPRCNNDRCSSSCRTASTELHD